MSTKTTIGMVVESVAKVPEKTATTTRGPPPPWKTLAELPGRPESPWPTRVVSGRLAELGQAGSLADTSPWPSLGRRLGQAGTGGQAACFQQWRDALRRVRMIFAISSTVLLFCVFAWSSETTQSDNRIESLPRDLVVENPSARDIPTVYIMGQTEIKDGKAIYTKGFTLNGVRLTERLLSRSVLILYPGGGGQWGYNTGFEIFRGPYFDGKDKHKQLDPRTLMEYAKVNYDPLDRVSVGGGDMNLLVLYNQKPLTPLRYDIAFPDPIRIKSFSLDSNCDGIKQKGVEITVTLFADLERKNIIATKVIGGDKGGFPVVFKGLDANRVIFEMSAVAPEGMVACYYTRLEAELDTGSLELPVLEPGRNVIKAGADADSSAQARVIFKWLKNKPSGDMIVDDFEDKSSEEKWEKGGKGVEVVKGSFEDEFAFTGKSFGRFTFPAEGNHSFSRDFSPPLDLGKCNCLGIAGRVKEGAPMYTMLIRLHHADAGWQRWIYGLSPAERWNYQTFDIKDIKRDKITGVQIYFAVSNGYSRPESPCVYDMDTLSFYQEDKITGETPLPRHVADYKSPYEGITHKKREAPPVQEWFPMGFYGGLAGSATKQEVVWLLDHMKKLNMNTVYISNGTLDDHGARPGLAGLVPLAEARGVRLIYQGTCPGALFYMGATPVERQRYLEKEILPAARKRVPGFKDSWSIAAWSLTEEISPEMSREMKPYYDLMRELAPNQPPTVLHNNLEAARVDFEVNRPLVITHDRYPFFWYPRSGPCNPGRSIPWYLRLSGYYKLCRQYGASLWMMPQAWGGDRKEEFDPPCYGDEHGEGVRKPEPGEIKQQGWLAVAEGASGIMFFAAVSGKPDTYHLWDYGFVESENTRAAGELFGQLTRVAPLLVRLERDYKEEGFVSVKAGKAIAHSFVKRKGYSGAARYVLLASLDGFEPQNVSVEVTGGGKVYDLVSRKEITGQLGNIPLEAGGGMVLLTGTESQYKDDCRMIEEHLDRYYREPRGFLGRLSGWLFGK